MLSSRLTYLSLAAEFEEREAAAQHVDDLLAGRLIAALVQTLDVQSDELLEHLHSHICSAYVLEQPLTRIKITCCTVCIVRTRMYSSSVEEKLDAALHCPTLTLIQSAH